MFLTVMLILVLVLVLASLVLVLVLVLVGLVLVLVLVLACPVLLNITVKYWSVNASMSELHVHGGINMLYYAIDAKIGPTDAVA